jgi:hypothetical protein
MPARQLLNPVEASPSGQPDASTGWRASTGISDSMASRAEPLDLVEASTATGWRASTDPTRWRVSGQPFDLPEYYSGTSGQPLERRRIGFAGLRIDLRIGFRGEKALS